MTYRSMSLIATGFALTVCASAASAAGERTIHTPAFGPSVQSAINTPTGTSGVGCSGANLTLDPSIEATNPTTFANPNWSSTSSSFGTSICNAAGCGSGGGVSNPRTGTFFAWFGGTNGAEVGTLSQTLTMPVNGPHFLNFYLRIATVTAPFDATLQIQVDGTTVQTITEPATAEAAYQRVTVDLGAAANGASHVINFLYTNGAASGTSSFTIDDITLECTTPVSLQNFGID